MFNFRCFLVRQVSGEVTLKYGRATPILFPKVFTQCCLQRRMKAHLREADKLLHLGVTSDSNGFSCKRYLTRDYWKSQCFKFYEIARAESMVLAFLSPRGKELVYFSRFQRVACYTTELYLCFMVCFLWWGIGFVLGKSQIQAFRKDDHYSTAFMFCS